MSELIYGQDTGFVLFEDDVTKTLNNFRQNGKRNEAGGILIGFRRDPHLHVISCTTPYKKDKCSRFEFLRRDPLHNLAARRYWKESKGQIYYLGDWHTHPVATPLPSSIDHHEWRKLTKSKLGPDLLFVIVGRTKWYVQYKSQTLHLLGI